MSEKGSKALSIRQACDDCDIERLCELACEPGGLVSDELRRSAWPILLGCADQHIASDSDSSDNATSSTQTTTAWEDLPPHRDEGQVKLDVDRAFVYYPSNEDAATIDARKRDLSTVITAVLRAHPFLHYFQGYHDIVQVFLLVFGSPTAAIPSATRLSLLRIRDYMLPTMGGALSQLHLLPSILQAADPALHRHLSGTEPFFALAATLTLYAHDMQEYNDIARLFDFLLATEAISSLYLFVAITLSRKEELLQLGPDEPEMLHFTLSKLPQPLDLDGLISRTLELVAAHPPEKLPRRAWSRVSVSSALKTARSVQQIRLQGQEDGERWFQQQAREIRWQEATRRMALRSKQLAVRYQRPAFATGFAIAAAVLAFWIRKAGISAAGIGISGTSDIYALVIGLRQKGLELVHHFAHLLR